MNRLPTFACAALLAVSTAAAQDSEPADAANADDTLTEQAPADAEMVAEAAVDPSRPRAMSGMSILGNEEAPKALVIIPWKSSELGDEIGMPEHMDDRATPVDREVFLRELRFYEIREDGEP
jgi:hypothetical protein